MDTAQREIAELYQRLGPMVFRRALKLLGNRDDAADATQQVFLKLLERPQRLREAPERVVPFLLEVTTNHCYNRSRDARRRGQQLEIVGAAQTETGPDSERQISDRQLAHQVLTRLDMQGSQIAGRVLVAEEDHQRVAVALGVSEKTVQRKLKRFLELAKKIIARSV